MLEIVGYPKTGSNTLHSYFTCIGLKSNHMQNGERMVKLLANGNRTILSGDPKVHTFMQRDTNFGVGYYPQISLLDELHELKPNSTFVFNFRPIRDWINSTRRWYELAKRFAHFDMPGLVLTPNQRAELEAHRLKIANMKHHMGGKLGQHITIKDVQLAKWWCGHVLHMREYVKEYPSHVLIELDLYDTNGTVSSLYDLFQADTDAHHASEHEHRNGTTTQPSPSQQCWGHENKS